MGIDVNAAVLICDWLVKIADFPCHACDLVVSAKIPTSPKIGEKWGTRGVDGRPVHVEFEVSDISGNFYSFIHELFVGFVGAR